MEVHREDDLKHHSLSSRQCWFEQMLRDGTSCGKEGTITYVSISFFLFLIKIYGMTLLLISILIMPRLEWWEVLLFINTWMIVWNFIVAFLPSDNSRNPKLYDSPRLTRV